jgi:hypothetical protein
MQESDLKAVKKFKELVSKKMKTSFRARYSRNLKMPSGFGKGL